jgi:hypothetical protein
MDIKVATQNAGSNEVYTKGEVEYEAQTVENMRENVLKRAKQTLKELKAYQGGPLNAPMARSGRNCIKVKIGYGKRNAALFEYGKDETERRHNADTVEQRREAAIATIKTAIASIKAGGLDKYLEAYLITRRTRSTNGTKVVQKYKVAPHLVGEKAAA